MSIERDGGADKNVKRDPLAPTENIDKKAAKPEETKIADPARQPEGQKDKKSGMPSAQKV